MSEHTDTAECACGVRVATVHGCEVLIHQPMTPPETIAHRREMEMPNVWTYAGTPGLAMTQLERENEADAIESVRRLVKELRDE